MHDICSKKDARNFLCQHLLYLPGLYGQNDVLRQKIDMKTKKQYRGRHTDEAVQ